ncbi:MAG TPA: sulfotransferase [Rhizomicrobium sp.]|nr:sulfotransferase [Rhizomicrobium sp.]
MVKEIPDTLLGMQLFKQGQLARAASHFRRALATDAGNYEALNLLGVISAQLGRQDEAIGLLQRAVAAYPLAPEAHNNLGMALNLAKRHDEAVPVLEKAVSLSPSDAVARNNLGVAHQALGHRELAVACFQRACQLRPDYVEALSNFGAALHMLKRDESAVAVLSRALQVNPRFAQAHSNLAAALLSLDRIDDAVAACERAISLDRGNAEAQAQAGTTFLALGKFEEARRRLGEAVRLAPSNPSFYGKLVSCYTVEPADPHLKAMEQLHARIDELPGDGPTELHFALAKAYTDTGEHQRAFDQLTKGNDLKRRSLQYDEATTLCWLGRIGDIFSPELMRRNAGLGALSAKPVFIVGMMRSGSTLVEQILVSHPAIVGAGERPYLREAYERVRQQMGTELPYPEFMETARQKQLTDIGRAYLTLLENTPLAGEASRITDKMLSNFAMVGLIHLALPNARIIHTCRDPVATCLSAYSKLFTDEQPFTYDLGELGRYYAAYRRLMAHWREVLPAGVMLDVQYESLVDNFEAEARRIVAHCGLDWDEKCLSFYETERAVRTASAAQVRKPIYKSATGRWRPSDDLLAPLLAGLNSMR